MQVPEWRNVIGEMVREHMRSPELEHYFSVKMNKSAGAAHDHAAGALHPAPAGLLGAGLGQLPGDGDQAGDLTA